jgi:glycosyltransferase involved in cell wall biosynthesis
VPGLVHVLAPAVVIMPASQSAVYSRASLTPAVRRALAGIEAAIEPLRVTVDLRCCVHPLTGTQVHALNLAASLAQLDEVRLSVLIPAFVHESIRPHLEALPSSVTRHTEGGAIVPSPHVFHRPYQLLNENDVTGVVTAGARLVVTHQDMILDRTPAYFTSKDDWLHFTARTALTFVAADEVAFFSEHAREEAVRDCLIDEQRTSVVPPGTDHLREVGDTVMPAELRRRRPEVPFVLVIGNSYFHKNRLFALRVSDELRNAHGWEGLTVFAGGNPGTGSSAADEHEFVRERPELGTRLVDLSHVSDAERHWLYREAKLVLFPTLYEGFGLVPFEAAAAGTACVYSGRSSVAEFLPTEGALLDLGDIVESARRLHTVLESCEAGEAIVRSIRLAGRELTWRRTAESYVDIYRRAMNRPVGLSLALGHELAVAPSTEMISSDTERRVLVALRRSRIVRLTAGVIVGVASGGRRIVRRFSRSDQ